MIYYTHTDTQLLRESTKQGRNLKNCYSFLSPLTTTHKDIALKQVHSTNAMAERTRRATNSALDSTRATPFAAAAHTDMADLSIACINRQNTMSKFKKIMSCSDSSRLRGDPHLGIGVEIDSWVVEKEVPLERSSSISDHESRLPGHSSKKGLSGWFSCLTFAMSPPPPPLKERRPCSWDSEAMVTCPSSCDGSKWEYEKPPCRRPESLAFDSWYGGTLDGTECHELSFGESMVKPLVFVDAPEKKLSSPTSDLAPREYLHNHKHINL
jgi:hypothetical protein